LEPHGTRMKENLFTGRNGSFWNMASIAPMSPLIPDALDMRAFRIDSSLDPISDGINQFLSGSVGCLVMFLYWNRRSY